MARSTANRHRHVSLVLGGGVGLGAYQAGAYEALHERDDLEPEWLAGSSVGGVNAAAPFEGFASLYDLSPMRVRLAGLIDFDRLNRSGPRVSINTTDLETGDMVVFDTEQGARIEVAHLMASCGYLPEFAPVEIGGRLLGDGGLSANAPAEIVIGGHAPSEEHIVFVLDLFARDGERPSGLESALARKNDLMFGNQTFVRLEALARELALREEVAALRKESTPTRWRIFYLSYRPRSEEAGPEKPFDFSAATIEDRWRAGLLDMREALRLLDEGAGDSGQLVHVRREPASMSARLPEVATAASG